MEEIKLSLNNLVLLVRFNLFFSASFYFLGASRSQTRAHFLLDQKVGKNQSSRIRVRIMKIIPLPLTVCYLQLHVAGGLFMSGSANFIFMRTLIDLIEFFFMCPHSWAGRFLRL